MRIVPSLPTTALPFQHLPTQGSALRGSSKSRIASFRYGLSKCKFITLLLELSDSRSDACHGVGNQLASSKQNDMWSFVPHSRPPVLNLEIQFLRNLLNTAISLHLSKMIIHVVRFYWDNWLWTKEGVWQEIKN